MGIQTESWNRENGFPKTPIVFQSTMTRQEFHEFIQKNEEFKIERDRHGVITIYPGGTLQSSYVEGEGLGQLSNWSKANKLGQALGASMHYVLPDQTEVRAGCSLISTEKLNELSPAQLREITPIVPDFVMEVRSVSDSLEKLKKKMTDVWIANGVKLAWLIDPMKQQAFIYRQDGSIEEVQGFDNFLSGEDVLPGFELDLRELNS